MIEPNRIIQIEGDGLLPPVYEPQIPADIRPNEIVRVVPPCPPWVVKNAADMIAVFEGRSPEDHRYWRIGETYERRLPSLERWEGDPGLPLLAGRGLGLDKIPDSTVLHYESPAKRIRYPDYQDFLDFMIVSDRLLQLWQEVDPDAIVAKPIIIKGRDGEVASDRHFVVDVVRNLAAIDLANSIVQYRGPVNGYPAHYAGTVSTRIRDDLDPSFHIFREKFFNAEGGGSVIVSDTMRQHMDAVRPKLVNTAFSACAMS